MANAFHEIAPGCGASTSSSSKPCYDVFINHRGPDVKRKLASTIYHWLDRTGVRAFLDENELELGGSFPQDLEEAMKSASVHIAIFSPTYAESPWCLEELSFMLQLDVTIIPVFYHVDPSDLRYVEKGKYADAFRQHKTKRGLDGNPRYNPEKIKEWEAALSKASWLSGCILFENNCDQGKLLKEIVETAVQKIKKMPLEVAMFPIGLEEAVEDFESKVGSSTGSDNVQIVGIVGMGGSGKTTLAKQLYNKKRSLENSMSRCCFLSNVSDFSRSTLHTLQKNLLQDLCISHSDFHNKDQGQGILRECLQSMKVLIVFDDVDHVDQMDALLPQGTIENLERGSFIIVTTRNGDFLKSWRSCSIYHMKLLDNYKANQLFCKHAFSQLYSPPEFEHLVKRFVKACHGLPLSLKVLGAMMKGRCEANYWEDQLIELSIMEHKDIAETLKLSYYALDRKHQQMFLDIACFFIGGQKSLVVSIWYGSGWGGQLGWETLVDRCLVSLDEIGNIDMHDHLRDLGRAIANDVSPSPSRIWKEEQIEEKIIFPRDYEGGFVIRGIISTTREHLGLTPPYQGPYPLSLEHCMENLIKKRPIPRLQLLVVKGNDFREEFEALSRNLVWLRWCDFEGKNLPSWLSFEKLSVLELYNAVNLEELWQDNVQLRPLQLRELIIEGARLRRLPTSIGDLKHLKKIVLKGIGPGMKSLPGAFCKLGSLEFLELEQFPMLSSLPHPFGKLTNLQTLKLNDMGLKELPNLNQLTKLETLYIIHCPNLTSMPASLGELSSLTVLKIRSCNSLEKLPESLGRLSNLRSLEIAYAPVVELGMGNLKCLKSLSLTDTKLCRISIPDDCCPSLEELDLRSNDSLIEIETLPKSVREINVCSCEKLKNMRGIDGLTKQVSLRTLELGECELRELPNMDHISKLETLQIDNCRQLQNLSLLTNQVSLRKLDLNKTGLEELPNLDQLIKLETLNISECPILTSLPASLGELSSLTSLKIDYCNSLKELPESLGRLSNLRSLQITRTPVVELGVGNLKCLKSLSLEFTELCRISIPDDCCPSLESLYLGFNDSLIEIETLPESVRGIHVWMCTKLKNMTGIDRLSNLESLAVRQTPVVELGMGNFKSLKSLTLKQTKLCSISIPDDCCPSLEELHLDENDSLTEIKTLPESVREIYVSRCKKLKNIRGIDGLSNLEKLEVEYCPELEVFQVLPSNVKLWGTSIVSNSSLVETKLCSISIPDDCCPSLEELHLILNDSLTEIETLPEGVRRIVVGMCKTLKNMRRIHGLSNLERLVVEHCPDLEVLPRPSVGCKVSIYGCPNAERDYQDRGIHFERDCYFGVEDYFGEEDFSDQPGEED